MEFLQCEMGVGVRGDWDLTHCWVLVQWSETGRLTRQAEPDCSRDMGERNQTVPKYRPETGVIQGTISTRKQKAMLPPTPAISHPGVLPGGEDRVGAREAGGNGVSPFSGGKLPIP